MRNGNEMMLSTERRIIIEGGFRYVPERCWRKRLGSHQVDQHAEGSGGPRAYMKGMEWALEFPAGEETQR